MTARLVAYPLIALAFVPTVTASGCSGTPPQPPEPAASSERLMTPQDLEALPSRPADWRVDYGPEASQYGELRVPAGAGPHPVVILIHGGCFKAAYATARDLAPMADALKDDGIATWNIEYRRLGEAGGGWPGTYLDVGRAVDRLRTLASAHELDLSRVIIVGHSAGGHLAMWAAARARVPGGSPIHAEDPLRIRGVIDLAGPLDLTANISGYETLCDDAVITGLLGGTPTTVPERYAQASPAKLLPMGVPQVVFIGEYEEFVPHPFAEAYVHAAAQAGDRARLIVIPAVGHFELASPWASPWPRVQSAIRSLLDGKLPAEDGEAQ